MKRYAVKSIPRFPVSNHYLSRVSSYRGGIRL